MLHMLARIQYAVYLCHVLDALDLDFSLHLSHPLVLVLEMGRFGSIEMELLRSHEMTRSLSFNLFLSQYSLILNFVRATLKRRVGQTIQPVSMAGREVLAEKSCSEVLADKILLLCSLVRLEWDKGGRADNSMYHRHD